MLSVIAFLFLDFFSTYSYIQISKALSAKYCLLNSKYPDIHLSYFESLIHKIIHQGSNLLNLWKTHQEKEMFLQKGNALKDEKLSNFLRMLNVSIPHKSFDDIKSYALLLIDQDRNLVEAGLNL